MKIFVSNSLNPFFNLSLEEYLFKNFKDDILLLYINKPSVIIGKHQIPFKEVNLDFIEENDITLCRRFSGGGAVYHDKGNLNFSIITTNRKPGLVIDFKKYLDPLYEFLYTLRLRVNIDHRNNILLNKKKISGNAQHIEKKRTLHHGTLLFDANLKKLKASLRVDQSAYDDKSVVSKPAKVGNLKGNLPMMMNVKVFRSYMIDFYVKKFDAGYIDLSEKQVFEIFELAMSKYSSPEWIYDYSPDYTFSKTYTDAKGETIFSFDVSNGIVNSFQIEGVHQKMFGNFLRVARGEKHRPEVFAVLLNNANIENDNFFANAGISETLFF
jgi:lipoate---protein ligase